MSYPHVTQLLEKAKANPTLDTIIEWWFEKNRHNYSYICRISTYKSEFTDDGIIVRYFHEYCDYNTQGYEYPSELREPILIPYSDFWSEIFENNEENLMWFYENYEDICKNLWSRTDLTPNTWYEQAWYRQNNCTTCKKSGHNYKHCSENINKVCHLCSSDSHLAPECTVNEGKYICEKCDREGHYSKYCRYVK